MNFVDPGNKYTISQNALQKAQNNQLDLRLAGSITRQIVIGMVSSLAEHQSFGRWNL